MEPDADGRKTVTLELPLAPDYEDEHVAVTSQVVAVTLDLRGGPRVFESELLVVGSYQGADIVAGVAFNYDYDRDTDELTIRGNDDRTSDQLTITTALAAPGDFADQLPALAFAHHRNDIGVNLPAVDMWADHVVGHPALVDAFAATAHAANDAIVRQAIDAGITSVVELGTPPIVTLENVDGWKMMFGEPITDVAPEDAIAEVIRVQFKVNSTYVGTVTWTLNYNFANVIGSTNDPKVPGFPTWIGLWETKCNGNAGPAYCSSYNYFSQDPTKHCSGIFVGGHVVSGTSTSSPPQGATVYIFPICQTHNANNGGYMKMKYNPKGVKLSYW